MKTLNILILTIIIAFNGFSQQNIKFYTDANKTATYLKCGKFNELKIKFKTPSSVRNYDKVILSIFSSANQAASARIVYIGGDVKTLASEGVIQKWLVRPNKKNGVFVFTGSGHFGYYDVCEQPREKGLSNVNIEVQLTGYNKTGRKKYYDDFHNEWRYKTLYSKGKLLAKGKISIGQLPVQTDFISANGVMQIKKIGSGDETIIIGDDTSHKSENAQKTASFFNKLNKTGADGAAYFEKFGSTQLKKSNKGYAQFLVYFFNDDKLAAEVKRLFGKVPGDFNPYEELKRDLLQQFAFNTYPNIYRKPFFKFPKLISKTFCPEIQDDMKKLKRGNINFFTNMSLWKKENVGNYQYDVLNLKNCYGEQSYFRFDKSTGKFRSKTNVDTPADVKIYAIKRGKYSVFIIPNYGDNSYLNVFLKDNNPNIAKQQSDFIEKTLKSVKFLK